MFISFLKNFIFSPSKANGSFEWFSIITFLTSLTITFLEFFNLLIPLINIFKKLKKLPILNFVCLIKPT